MIKRCLFAFAILFTACSKNTNPVTPNNPPSSGFPSDARFIPNWYSEDTLYALVIDTMSQWTGGYDTIITKTVNDTSMIFYKGVKYYIWWNSTFTNDTFKLDQNQYANVSISTTADTTGIVSKSTFNFAIPHKYKDHNGITIHQQQSIVVNARDGTPFIGWNGIYTSRRTY